MTSSVRLNMAAQEKAKKVAQREAENATEKGKKPEDNQQQRAQVEVGGSSAKASGGDSSKQSKKATKEKEAPKAPAKKRGRPRKAVQQDS